MRIVHYPHPALLRASKPILRVDAELRQAIREMFDLMYEHRGVGLAANQVDLPYRLFVVNVTGDAAQPEEEQVYLNPVLSSPKGSDEDEEGCLSLPEVWAPVRRPERVTVNAYNLAGEEITQELSGLPARIIQHEFDHIGGTLFVDRLAPSVRASINEQLAEFELEFDRGQQRGEIPSHAEIVARLERLERERT